MTAASSKGRKIQMETKTFSFEISQLTLGTPTTGRVLKTAVANSAIWPLTWVFWSLNGGLRFPTPVRAFTSPRSAVAASLDPSITPCPVHAPRHPGRRARESPPHQVYNPIRLSLINPCLLLQRVTMPTIRCVRRFNGSSLASFHYLATPHPHSFLPLQVYRGDDEKAHARGELHTIRSAQSHGEVSTF